MRISAIPNAKSWIINYYAPRGGLDFAHCNRVGVDGISWARLKARLRSPGKKEMDLEKWKPMI